MAKKNETVVALFGNGDWSVIAENEEVAFWRFETRKDFREFIKSDGKDVSTGHFMLRVSTAAVGSWARLRNREG